jgi:maleate isomerase
VELAADYGVLGRLGLLLPSGNIAAEAQFAAAKPPGLSLHWTRLPLAGSSESQLCAMAKQVRAGAALLSDAQVDLIAFHCTAVSTWQPEREAQILRDISEVSRRPAIATSQAIVAALHALGVRRIVMLSPYVEHIARREEVFLKERGFDVLDSQFLGIADPHDMFAVTPSRWADLLRFASDTNADAYLLSCTAIRAWEAVFAAEMALRRPVITSNSSMLWYSSRRLGYDGPLDVCGRLGACQPSTSR